VFVIRNSPLFGPNLEQKTAQVLNKSIIADRKGEFLDRGDGFSNVTSFATGDTLYISAANTSCSILQPVVASNDRYCFCNTDNVGKMFSLEVSDKRGNIISRSDVYISP